MPLQLGDDSTDRGHIISYDPHSPAERLEADLQLQQLVDKGYRTELEDRDNGFILLQPPERLFNHGMFRILSENGDDRVVWDRSNPNQVREAYAKYNDLIQKGYTAYATFSDGNKAHKLDDFDPGLEEILMVPKSIPG